MKSIWIFLKIIHKLLLVLASHTSEDICWENLPVSEKAKSKAVRLAKMRMPNFEQTNWKMIKWEFLMQML